MSQSKVQSEPSEGASVTKVTVLVEEEGGDTLNLVFLVSKAEGGQWLIEHEREVLIEGEDDPHAPELRPYLTGKGKFHLALAYNQEIRIPRPIGPVVRE